MSDAMMAILACSATMTALTLLALLVSPLLERRYARGALYALWLAVMLGFLVPVRPVLPKAPVLRVELPQAMSEPLRRAPAAVAVNPGAQALTPQAANAGVQDAGEQLSRASGGLRGLAAGMLDALSRMTPAQAIAALYLMGALLTLLVQLMRHARFMRTVRRWQRPAGDGSVRAAYARACAAMGVRQPPALMTCAAVSSPMLVGIFHPRILLPESAPQGDALDMVLRHELTHHRRHDLLLRLLMLLARAMHWFNPAVYLCERAAVHYGELSCDERAVRGTDRDQRAAYSGAILAALRGSAPARSLLTTSFSADKRLLKRRLIAMMDMRVRRRGAFAAVLALGLSVLLGASLVLADGEKSAPEKDGGFDVVAQWTLEGEATGGATVSVGDVYFDGYLLMVNTRIEPSAEDEAIYTDVILGDGEPWKREIEEEGLVPVGVYCEGGPVDGKVLDYRSGSSWRDARAVMKTDAYAFPPEEARGELTVQLAIGLMETPGEILGGDEALQAVDFSASVTEPAGTRELWLLKQNGALPELDTLFVAETDEYASLYFLYTGEKCPVEPVDIYNDALVIPPFTAHDAQRDMDYLYYAVEKDGPLERVRVRDNGGKTYTVDLNNGTVTDDGVVSPWNVPPMTAQEMRAIYADSNARMNNTAEWTDGRAFLAAYEAEMTAQGKPFKEDMIVSTLPDGDDMPYDVALEYAMQIIMDKYGAPRDELEAMGVYPDFYDYPYYDWEPQWEFYFTSRRDTDIMLDHDYPELGEYRVTFGAHSGEVEMCFWYVADFWRFAERIWGAGKREMVYEEFLQNGFLKLDGETQEMWKQRLAQAGYDVDVERSENLHELMVREAYWLTAEESMLRSDDPRILTALHAIERDYGLNVDELDRYRYVATISPYNTGDTCVVVTVGGRYGEAGNACIDDVISYASKLGSFVVTLNANTGEQSRAISHLPYSDEPYQAGQKLLEQPNWTEQDLPEFEALIAKVEVVVAAHPDDIWAQRREVYPLMIEAGGSESMYTLPELSPEDAVAAARAGLAEHLGLSEAEFAEIYEDGADVQGFTATTYMIYLDVREDAPQQWKGRNYFLDVDGTTGELLGIAISQ